MPNVLEWLSGQDPIVQAIVRVLLVVAPILILVPGLIWWERRLLSWMQDRIGPNLTGDITLKSGKRIKLFGLLQPIADGVKLFLKEEIIPANVDRIIYVIAPALALFPAFALGMTLPWGPLEGPLKMLHPAADVNIGVLYVIAISSLGAYGIVLAGYASNNKYSLMGGLRSSAQLISYELGMGMAIAALVLATGSLKMTDIVAAQMEPLYGLKFLQNWHILTPYGLIAAVIFAICIVAETNRAPFDLPEAENEIIAGYHTEYSSMKFAVFFMGEYAAMFIFSGVFAALFLGGYNLLPVNWDALGGSFGSFMSNLNYWGAPAWFLGKCAFGITVFIWLRATLPRLRYDQLMNLGWRSLLPLAVVNFLLVATWILVTSLYGVAAGWAALIGGWALVAIVYTLTLGRSARKSPAMASRRVRLVEGGRSELEAGT